MKKLFLRALLFTALCLAVLPVPAEKTRHWRQSSFDDFEAGIADRVSIRSDGKVALAPKLEELYDASASYLWDLAVDDEGTVYAAAGPEARVFRLGADGRKSVLFETDAVEVHALAVDRDGNVYAATAPESRVYKIDPSGGYEVFYDPRASYVWDMAIGPDGALYLATGDEGKLHRVTPSGDGEVFFETGETHVRSLAFDSNGDVILGTDPGGLVMRVTDGPEGARGFVLHQSPKKEMTAVAAGADGVIYAAGAGGTNGRAAHCHRHPSRAGSTLHPAVHPNTHRPAAGDSSDSRAVGGSLAGSGGSSIVRIAADGEPLEIWTHARDIVYSLGFDAEGKLLAGTGERGRLIRIESEHVYSVVTSVTSSQITAIANGADGRTLLATSNVGRILGTWPRAGVGRLVDLRCARRQSLLALRPPGVLR